MNIKDRLIIETDKLGESLLEVETLSDKLTRANKQLGIDTLNVIASLIMEYGVPLDSLVRVKWRTLNKTIQTIMEEEG